jgi:hypothetical protein
MTVLLSASFKRFFGLTFQVRTSAHSVRGGHPKHIPEIRCLIRYLWEANREEFSVHLPGIREGMCKSYVKDVLAS